MNKQSRTEQVAELINGGLDYAGVMATLGMSRNAVHHAVMRGRDQGLIAAPAAKLRRGRPSKAPRVDPVIAEHASELHPGVRQLPAEPLPSRPAPIAARLPPEDVIVEAVRVAFTGDASLEAHERGARMIDDEIAKVRRRLKALEEVRRLFEGRVTSNGAGEPVAEAHPNGQRE